MRTMFDDAPALVFWETTKACPLTCRHCRATAQPEAAPGELDTNEGFALIDSLAAAPGRKPVLVFTGGDCLVRDDIVALAARAGARGIPVAIAPAVSPRLRPALVRQLREAGVAHASISLDGARAATHDDIRQVPGHFEATLDALAMLAAEGVHVQVNTAVMARNADEIAGIAALLHGRGVGVWEVFFLVNVGRGDREEALGAAQCEDVCNFLVDVAQRGTVVRTVEAPFYRRVLVERAAGAAAVSDAGPLYRRLAGELARSRRRAPGPVPAPSMATRDGKGIVFVAHDGDVYPSGFLPLRLGNVRERPLLDIYRRHSLLRAIRAGRFSGACGRCPHRDLCGGSRARAYASSGDPLGADPSCVLVAGAAGVALSG
jgi:radical SAM protein